ncbi:MAG: glucokinase [Gammaproteobacteria bacterium]
MSEDATSLIADVGGTHTRCALLDRRGSRPVVHKYRNERFDSLRDVIRAFLADHAQTHPTRGALAVAAPIVGDRVEFTNRRWQFSIRRLADALELERLDIINDFAAQALALPVLTEADTTTIGGGETVPDGTRAVLGPGTGIGVAGLVRAGEGWITVPGEGGHVTLAASTEPEARIITRLRERFGHCSAERVLSGPGLTNLYEALAAETGVAAEELEPEDVTARAAKGDPLASRCLEHFFAFLGTVASDVALTFGAIGGVYLSGGILPQVSAALLASSFRARFEDKGRYRDYLAAIPTRLITVENPALLGLQHRLGLSS